MQFAINQGNKRGKFHEQRGISNQDAVCGLTKNQKCVICLADGAGSRQMSQYGASCVANETCNYLSQNFSELYSKGSEIINTKIMELINNELEALAEKYKVTKSQFASTLLFAATDGDKYITGHLGDGCIISMHGLDWNVISFPQNGEQMNSTYLTTTFEAEKHLRIKCGKCQNITGFLIASDGILQNVFGSSFSFSKSNSLVQKFIEKIKENTLDDASYICCSWEE